MVSISKEEFIEEYSKVLIKGNAAIFAGAGLSTEAGFVNWHNLIKPLATKIGLNSDKETDLISVAQYYINEDGGNKHDISEIINNFFDSNEIPENIKIISRLPIHTFWTTNYDSLLEDGLKDSNKLVDIKRSIDNLNNNKYNRDAVIYKMHGDKSQPNKTIISKDDYESYEEKYGLFRTLLKADLLSKTFLFIGFSFDDPNLQYILAQLRLASPQNLKTHYCFFEKIKQDKNETDEDFNYRKIKQDLKIEDLRRYGIKAIILDNYSKITEILNTLESTVLQKKIFVSGSIDKYDSEWTKEKVNEFTYLLGNDLVKNDYTVVSGFGSGIGSSIINGSLREIFDNKNGHVDDYLKLYPFPQTKNSEELWPIYREKVMKNVGICIFIFGNKIQKESNSPIDANGVISEFNIAKKYKKIIIPIGSTGWASKTIWNEVNQNIHEYPYLRKYIDKLGSEKDPEQIMKLIKNIISDLPQGNNL